jgi:hypothetical protein
VLVTFSYDEACGKGDCHLVMRGKVDPDGRWNSHSAPSGAINLPLLPMAAPSPPIAFNFRLHRDYREKIHYHYTWMLITCRSPKWGMESHEGRRLPCATAFSQPVLLSKDMTVPPLPIQGTFHARSDALQPPQDVRRRDATQGRIHRLAHGGTPVGRDV